MIHQLNKLIIILGIVALVSCDTVDSSESANFSEEWLIPENQVFDGGPGKDGIPALTNPEVASISSISYLEDDDLVLVFKHSDEVRIYPHPILDWHEIINDKIDDKAISITYCPLTGSGIAWDRVIDGEETTFGVSGLLYNSNLIPYDRKTGSNWSQMRIQSINGPLISSTVTTYPLVETSWATAKLIYPDAKVVTSNTGFSRNYNSYPYGDYRTNHSSFIFPTSGDDNRLNAKERVLGVFNDDKTKAYRISDFEDGRIITDIIGNDKFLIYSNQQKNLISAFKVTNIPTGTEFTVSSNQDQFIINDNNGNSYDIFGNSKNSGIINLEYAKSFVAYWFAWTAFYQNTELYDK